MHPPLERCRECGNPTAFEDVAGTGVIYSFIVQRQPLVAGYVDQVPYVVALVELDEQPGLRLPTRMLGGGASEVHCGLGVQADLVDAPGGCYKTAVLV